MEIIKKKRVKVYKGCIPDDAVCLRWINTKGGLSVWVFVANTTVSINHSSIGTFKQGIKEYSLGREGRETLSLGFAGLNRQQAIGLSKMFISPRVEMLVDKENDLWEDVFIVDGSQNIYNTNNGTSTIEFSVSTRKLNRVTV